MFNTPSALKDNLINIVEIMNPEFRITLLNLSECKKENNSNKTSTRIRMVKKSSKNILLMSLMFGTIVLAVKKLSYDQNPRV
jgi:hypothetical protein